MIQIKNPCDASWQEMTPAESGKYCGACEKVVVDFSKMSDTQIKDYFTQYASQKTCGRFLTSQVDRKLHINKNYFQSLLNKIPRVYLVQSLIFFAASSFLWLSSCIKKQNTLGEPEYNDPSSHYQLMGDTVIMPATEDTAAAIPQEDTIPRLIGETTTSQEIRMGKVRMTDTISQRIKRRK